MTVSVLQILLIIALAQLSVIAVTEECTHSLWIHLPGWDEYSNSIIPR